MPQCKALTNQIHIDVSGFYTPCCFIVNKNTKNSIESCSSDEWLISSDIQSMQDIMKSEEWHDNCHSCKSVENEGRTSYRQLYNQEYTQPSGILESFHLNIRNKCNIRCRMCDPSYSDKWSKTRKFIPISSALNFREQYEKIKHLIGPNFKYLKIAGGEPFLDSSVFEVIELILEKCPDLTVQFHTNLTFFPKKYIHILDKVKTLRPSYSIDGVGLVNDYIRQDSKWESNIDVLHQWQDYIHSRSCASDEPIFQTSVQAYNFHDQHNIKNLMDSLNLSWIRILVDWPIAFNINALPPEYVKKHTNSVNEEFVVNYKFDEKLFEQLKARTFADDNLLGTTIQNYIPELYELFKN